MAPRDFGSADISLRVERARQGSVHKSRIDDEGKLFLGKSLASTTSLAVMKK